MRFSSKSMNKIENVKELEEVFYNNFEILKTRYKRRLEKKIFTRTNSRESKVYKYYNPNWK